MQDQFQKYTFIFKEQIIENFSLYYGGEMIWNSLPNDWKKIKGSV